MEIVTHGTIGKPEYNGFQRMMTELRDGMIVKGVVHEYLQGVFQAIPMAMIDGEWTFDSSRCKDVRSIDEGLEYLRSLFNSD